MVKKAANKKNNLNIPYIHNIKNKVFIMFFQIIFSNYKYLSLNSSGVII